MVLCAADVIELKCPPGQSFSFEEVKKAVEEHKPALLFLCQVSERLDDEWQLRSFNVRKTVNGFVKLHIWAP